ncbi:MAG: DNA repair protein RecO [Gammaproteobacteria bacterium]
MTAGVERIDLEIAYLLHARPYRESSRLLEIFSQRYGRVGLVANGARRPKSKWRGVLRSFQPLRLSWSGRGSLQTLRAVEASSGPFEISGLALMSGYYLNELLMLLMHRRDPHPHLFAHYGAALNALSEGGEPERILRRFEVSLLAEIGYGLVVDADVVDQQPLEADRRYEYVVDRGPVPVDHDVPGELVFSGAELMAIGRGEFADPCQLRDAKRLLRPLLHSALGGRKLKTREVLASMLR